MPLLRVQPVEHDAAKTILILIRLIYGLILLGNDAWKKLLPFIEPILQSKSVAWVCLNNRKVWALYLSQNSTTDTQIVVDH